MVVILLLSPCTCSRSSSSSHAHDHAHDPGHAPSKHHHQYHQYHQHQQHHQNSQHHQQPEQPPSVARSGDSRSSNESSSASTGDTAIPAGYLQLHHQKQNQNQNQKDPQNRQHSDNYPHQPSHSCSTATNTAPLSVFGHGCWMPQQPANAVPKPPRSHGLQWSSSAYPATHATSHQPVIFRVQSSLPNGSFTNATTTTTTTTDYVRHVTRVNFYDIDTSQVEFEPKDDEESNEVTASNCDTEAITKEGEFN